MAKFLLVFSHILIAAVPVCSLASPLVEPGDLRLRSDLQTLNDSGAIDIPLTAWPLSVGDIRAALSNIDGNELPPRAASAHRRIAETVRKKLEFDAVAVDLNVSAAVDSRFIRTFEDTPRDEGEVGANLSWTGDRFTVNVAATVAANPFDDEAFRPDGSYVGMAIGNWMLTAGWQDRWWGPGTDGSLILSTNARPSPGITVQRNVSTPFGTKWLRWIGPWTLTSFMTELDDERTVRNTRLFGIRGSFRPPKTGLEIGISRAAQWCGDARPCNLKTFADLLIGNDNRGVNVNPEDEPGNQLGGFDIRWRLPRQIPLALYMQWIGEDGRGGGGAIGSWLRQVGAEYWGRIGGVLRHRTHIEVSDTVCREGGFGFSGEKPDCTYEHGVYRSGYRYRNRVLGHPIDSDGLSYSLGSTLVQSAGHSWNISLRYMEINRIGSPTGRHTLSETPQEVFDVQLTHERATRYGRFRAGLGFGDANGVDSEVLGSGISAFLQWNSQ